LRRRYARRRSSRRTRPGGSLALPLLATAAEYTFAGKVLRVKDGDTIVVEDHDHHRNVIRLSGIDAPEKGSKKEPGQPFGERARQQLVDLVYGKDVTVGWHKYDKYGRVSWAGCGYATWTSTSGARSRPRR
jgi:endonuclease YncB( thermonuclease family)